MNSVTFRRAACRATRTRAEIAAERGCVRSTRGTNVAKSPAHQILGVRRCNADSMACAGQPRGRQKIAQHFSAGFESRAKRVPSGTKEAFSSSRRCRPCGTFSRGARHPVLKRWAIFGRPGGTAAARSAAAAFSQPFGKTRFPSNGFTTHPPTGCRSALQTPTQASPRFLPTSFQSGRCGWAATQPRSAGNFGARTSRTNLAADIDLPKCIP